MKIVFLLLYLLCTGGICRAQLVFSLDDDAVYVQELENELLVASSDSARAYICLRLSVLYRLVRDTAKAGEYLARGIALGAATPFIRGASYYYTAHALYAKRDIPAIEMNLLKGDSLLGRLHHKEAFKVRAQIWHAYATFQQMKGNEPDAMDAFIRKALPLAEQSGDLFLTGNVNKSIGTVLMNAGQREEAAGYLRTATVLIETSPADDPRRLETLVETYIIAAENDAERTRLDPAAVLLKKAEKHLKPQSNLYLMFYYAEGLLRQKQKQYNEAIGSFNRGIALGSTEPAAGFAVNRLQYAKYTTLHMSGHYKQAALLMEKILKSPLVLLGDKKNYYKELHNTYKKLGDSRSSLKWADAYIRLSDSLYEAKFQNDIVDMEKKYRASENERTIAKLEAEKKETALRQKNTRLSNQMWFAIRFALITTLFYLVFYYRNRRKRAGLQLKEMEQKQQLATAEAMLEGEERERRRVARDLHDGLGGLLAAIKMKLSGHVRAENSTKKDLARVIEQLDHSVAELRRIARNMMPESLARVGLDTSLGDLCQSLSTGQTQISYEAIGISAHIELSTQVIIYRIIQEALGNAIRHADARHILLQCSQNGDTFFITVEDDGTGFDKAKIAQRKGLGLSNIENRVKYLKGKLEIETKPNEGTIINVELNVAA